jgi:hypothetical protein
LQSDLQLIDWLCRSVRWNEPASLFPVVMPLLRTPHISPCVLEGLLISIGSKNKQTSQVSTAAFIQVLHEMSSDKLDNTISKINGIASANLNQNRVFLPILNALAAVGRSGLFSKVDKSMYVSKIKSLCFLLLTKPCFQSQTNDIAGDAGDYNDEECGEDHIGDESVSLASYGGMECKLIASRCLQYLLLLGR